MRFPLLFLALLAILAAPVVAVADLQMVGYDLADMDTFQATDSYLDYNAYTDGNLIAQLQIGVYPGTDCQITLYDSGQTIPAEINITADGTIYPSLGNQTIPSWGTSILSYPLGTSMDQIRHRFTFQTMTASIYSDDPSSKDLHLRMYADNAMTRSATVPLINTIYRIQIQANKPVEVTAWIAPEDDIYDQINARQEGTAGFLEYLGEIAGSIIGVVTLVWVIFKTVFIENFTLTVALYETIVMAYSFNKARDIFQAFSMLIRYNKAFLEFMVWILESIVSIITRIINAFKPI